LDPTPMWQLERVERTTTFWQSRLMTPFSLQVKLQPDTILLQYQEHT